MEWAARFVVWVKTLDTLLVDFDITWKEELKKTSRFFSVTERKKMYELVW